MHSPRPRFHREGESRPFNHDGESRPHFSHDGERRPQGFGFKKPNRNNGVYSNKKQQVYREQHEDPTKPVRLNKYLANAGICSRREAEDRLRTLGFRLGATEYIVGDPDWVYGVKVNGREVAAGTRLSVKTPVTLVVGGGGYEDEYNGNDSLDFIINSEQDAAEHEVLEE